MIQSTAVGDPVVIWGATGQARVVAPIVASTGRVVACICDRDPTTVAPVFGVPIFYNEDDFLTWLHGGSREQLAFVAAIGGSRGRDRIVVRQYLERFGIRPLSLVHSTAFVDDSVEMGAGLQVAAMAAIAVGVLIGEQCIVNTNATVDHDTVLGDGVHVMPGAALAGMVKVGSGTSIGTNATVLPRIRLGCDVVVGAGAVVTRDVPDGMTVVGVPARPAGRTRVSPIGANPWIRSEQACV